MIIRFADKDDNIAHLLSPNALMVLARKNILVAVEQERVVGLIVLFDAGHSVLYVDSLLLAPDAPSKTPIKLLEGVMDYCRTQGISDFYFVSSSKSLRSLAEHHGATITEANHYMAFVPVR